MLSVIQHAELRLPSALQECFEGVTPPAGLAAALLLTLQREMPAFKWDRAGSCLRLPVGRAGADPAALLVGVQTVLQQDAPGMLQVSLWWAPERWCEAK